MSKKIGKGIQRALMKGLKTFGIRPDDITDMLIEFDLDQFITAEFERIKKKSGENEIMIKGITDNSGKLYFKIYSDSGKTYKINFFGKEKESFTIQELIKELINIAFDSLQKDTKKEKKLKKKNK